MKIKALFASTLLGIAAAAWADSPIVRELKDGWRFKQVRRTNWYNATTFTNLTWQNSRKFASLKKGTATYSTAVIEVGYNICHSRTGLSLVMDFNGGDNDTYELYRRSGITTSSGLPLAWVPLIRLRSMPM